MRLYVELNEPGSGEVRIPLSTDIASQVTEGQFVLSRYRGQSRGGFFVENKQLFFVTEEEGTSKYLSIKGRGALAILDDGKIGTDGTGSSSRLFSGNRASILIQLIEEAQDRGCFPSLVLDFTDTLDSDTNAWTDEESISFSVGKSILEVVREFSKTGIDFYMDLNSSGDFVLHAYKNGKGQDKSSTVFFRVGTNCRELNEDNRGTDIRNAYLVKYKNGYISSQDDASIATKRRKEEFLNLENAQSVSSASSYATAKLNSTKEPRKSINVEVYDGVGPKAFVDYEIGDYITLDRDGIEESRRVIGMQLTWLDDKYATVVLTLNSTIVEQDIKTNQDLKWLLSQWDTARDLGLMEASYWGFMGPTSNDDEIRAIASYGNLIFFGGDFTSIGGVPAMKIASYNTLTGEWKALGSGLTGNSHGGNSPFVTSLLVDGDILYVGGGFDTAGGVTSSCIAKYNILTETWSAMGAGSNNFVQTMRKLGSYIYAGGNFTSMDGVSNTNFIARWNIAGSSWEALTISDHPSGTVFSLTTHGSNLYLGGIFTTIGGSPFSRIAMYDGSYNTLGSGLNDQPNSMCTIGDILYVGGEFTVAGGVNVDKVSKYDINTGTWSALAGGGITGLGAVVYSVTTDGINLYVGGDYDNAGGYLANSIAKWNSFGWQTLAGGVTNGGIEGTVYSVLPLESNVYVAGNFTKAGSKTTKNVSVYLTSFDSVADFLESNNQQFDMGAAIHSAVPVTTLLADDEIPLWGSVPKKLRKIVWSNVLLAIKAFTDTLYMAIGSVFTPSRLVITDSAGDITTSDDVIYDDTTKIVALGDPTPSGGTSSHIFYFDPTISAVHNMVSWGSGFASAFKGIFANGTKASPTKALLNDILVRFRGAGYDEVTGVASSPTSAEIRAVATEDFDGSSHGTKIEIYTTPNGSTTLTRVATFGSEGEILDKDDNPIGSYPPSLKIYMNQNLR